MNTNLITLSNNLLIEQCIYVENNKLMYLTRIIDKEGHVLDLTTYPSLGAMYRATKEIENHVKNSLSDVNDCNDAFTQELAKYLELRSCGLSDAEIQQSKAWTRC